MHILHWIKVSTKTNPLVQLSVNTRLLKTAKSDDPIVVVWSLSEPADANVYFDATGFFTWLQAVPNGVFSEPVRSSDGKRIVMDVSNPTQVDKAGNWKYKLRATGPNSTHYETIAAEPEEGNSGGGGGGGGSKDADMKTVTNPAIINR